MHELRMFNTFSVVLACNAFANAVAPSSPIELPAERMRAGAANRLEQLTGKRDLRHVLVGGELLGKNACIVII